VFGFFFLQEFFNLARLSDAHTRTSTRKRRTSRIQNRKKK